MALKAVLGRREVFTLAFGAIVGWGWVVLSGDLIEDAGTIGSILAFLAGGALVGIVGLTYAELTAALPRTGGELAFSYRALGPTAAWICSWVLLLTYVGISGFEAVALATVCDYLLPGFGRWPLYEVAGSVVFGSWVLVGIFGTACIATLNWFGIRTSALFQTLATIVLLVIGGSFVLGATVGGTTGNLQPMFTGWGGFLAVVTVTPFLMIGFDIIPQASEEISLPSAEIGRVLLAAVAMATLWYVLIQWSVGFSLSAEARSASELPTAAAAGAAFNSPTAARLVIGAGLMGILTSWNAMFVGATRLVLGMARARLLPAPLARLHATHQTPSGAIVFVTACTLVAPFLGRQALGSIANAASFSAVIAFLMVSLSFVILRRREPELPRPYRVRLGGVVGVAAVLVSLLFFCLYLPPSPSALIWPIEWGIVLTWFGLGSIAYLAGSRYRRSFTEQQRESVVLGPYARGGKPSVVIAED